MGKIPVVVLLALVLWVGITVYREGPEEAFGGFFSFLTLPMYGEGDRPPGRSEALADRVDEDRPRDEGDEKPWWSR